MMKAVEIMQSGPIADTVEVRNLTKAEKAISMTIDDGAVFVKSYNDGESIAVVVYCDEKLVNTAKAIGLMTKGLLELDA